MFLDDGVSRDSAPNAYIDSEKVAAAYASTGEGKDRFADVDTDPEAKNKFREIVFEQVCPPHSVSSHVYHMMLMLTLINSTVIRASRKGPEAQNHRAQ